MEVKTWENTFCQPSAEKHIVDRTNVVILQGKQHYFYFFCSEVDDSNQFALF